MTSAGARSNSAVTAQRPAASPNSLSHRCFLVSGPPQNMNTAVANAARHRDRVRPSALRAGMYLAGCRGTVGAARGGSDGAYQVVCDTGTGNFRAGGRLNGWGCAGAGGGAGWREFGWYGNDSMPRVAFRSHHVHGWSPEVDDGLPKYQWLGFRAHCTSSCIASSRRSFPVSRVGSCRRV